MIFMFPYKEVYFECGNNLSEAVKRLSDRIKSKLFFKTLGGTVNSKEVILYRYRIWYPYPPVTLFKGTFRRKNDVVYLSGKIQVHFIIRLLIFFLLIVTIFSFVYPMVISEYDLFAISILVFFVWLANFVLFYSLFRNDIKYFSQVIIDINKITEKEAELPSN